MHPTETKHQFVTLRARGLTLGKISEQLDVPKSTLGRWQSESEDEIQQLQRIEWEEIEAQYGYTLQDDLRRIMKRLRAAEDQLDARSLERFTRRELFQLIRESRREYEKKRALLFGTPKRDKMVRPPSPNSDSETSLNPQPPTFNQSENPSEIQPFSSQNRGSSSSDSLEGDAPRRRDSEAESPNPQSEIESGASVETQNPAKTLPFPCQNFGVHNPALSSLPQTPAQSDTPNGRAAAPPGAVPDQSLAPPLWRTPR